MEGKLLLQTLNFKEKKRTNESILQGTDYYKINIQGNNLFLNVQDIFMIFFPFKIIGGRLKNVQVIVNNYFFFDFVRSFSIIFQAVLGRRSKSLNSPAPFSHSPPSIVTTSPLI